LVELNGTLLELGFLIKSVPTEVKEAVAEITNEFVFTSGILHESKLKETNEGNDLSKPSSRDVVEGIESVTNVGEFGAI